MDLRFAGAASGLEMKPYSSTLTIAFVAPVLPCTPVHQRCSGDIAVAVVLQVGTGMLRKI